MSPEWVGLAEILLRHRRMMFRPWGDMQRAGFDRT
jgi:hypothetical protein